MHQNLKISLFLFTFLFLIFSAHASEDYAVYKANETFSLKIPCISSIGYCDAATNCTLTLFYKNDSVVLANVLMNRSDTFYYATIPPLQQDIYKTSVFCTNGTASGYAFYKIYVTERGLPPPSDGESIFILILTIAALLGEIGLIVYSIIKFIKLDLSIDIFLYGLFMLFFLFIVYWFNTFYIGLGLTDILLNTLLKIAIGINILIIGLLFITNHIIKTLVNKKENAGY